jgi:hypothetical protein
MLLAAENSGDLQDHHELRNQAFPMAYVCESPPSAREAIARCAAHSIMLATMAPDCEMTARRPARHPPRRSPH